MKTLEQRRARQAAVYDRIAAANKRRTTTKLVRKQISDQRRWWQAWNVADRVISKSHAQWLVDAAVARTRKAMDTFDGPGGGCRAAFGWSGGKDSLALEIVMEQADVPDCVFVITELEFPEFLRWATDHMPDGCEVIHRKEINLPFLRSNPEMLFPPDAAASGKWFSKVQHTGQKVYFDTRGLDVMFLGRRSMDGNVIGEDGWTRSQRGTFFNPIAGWTHEQVLGVLKHRGVELPPTYNWPRGWQVGTGPWAARQFCRSVDDGWAEIYLIDPTIVEQAASVLPSAERYVQKLNGGG